MQVGIGARAVLWLALLAASMAAVLYPAGTRVLDQNFREFEKAQIERDADRILLAIKTEGDRLREFTRDYGNWDSALAFIVGTNPNFIDENIYPAALNNLGAGLAFVVGPSRQVLWSGVL